MGVSAETAIILIWKITAREYPELNDSVVTDVSFWKISSVTPPFQV